MKITKNNKKLLDSIDVSKTYEPIEAIKILKENNYAKFDETLEVAINLGIDSNKTDQNIRGVINLPKGTGKKIKVAVLAKGEKQNEGKDAGADLVGESDLIDLISSGKSSLKAVQDLREFGVEVLALGAIFSYGFQKSIDNFKKESCSFSTLSNYSTLIDAALKNNYINKSDLDTLNHWRKNPANWKSNA